MPARDPIDDVIDEAERTSGSMPPEPPASSLDGAWQTTATTVRPRSKNGTPIATTFLVLIALIVLGVVVVGLFRRQPFIPDATGARLISERFVLDRLKAPAGATFAPSEESEVVQTPNGHYVVTAYVDAENSFSAKLGTHYIAELAPEADGWRLVSLRFVPRQVTHDLYFSEKA